MADAETGTILGVHVLADQAGEVIQAATLAVKFGLRIEDLVETFHPYLTMVEGLKLAALTFDKHVSRLPVAPPDRDGECGPAAERSGSGPPRRRARTWLPRTETPATGRAGAGARSARLTRDRVEDR